MVTAKISLKFRGSTRAMPKNGSKFTTRSGFKYKVLYKASGKKKIFQKISVGIILKYVMVSVVTKISLQLRGSTRELPKNRSKFTTKSVFKFKVLYKS